jgi:hypothetical protein
MDRPALSLEFEFTVENVGTADQFHDHGERVMQELLKLEDCDPDVTDSSVGTDYSDQTVTISVLVFADDEVQGLGKALAVIRSAVHAAGAATPFWPTVNDLVETDVEYQPPQIQMERARALAP